MHYNAYLGIDRIAYDSDNVFLKIYTVPAAALFVMILDIVLAFFIYSSLLKVSKEKKADYEKMKGSPKFIASKMLLGAAMALQIIILLYTVAIVVVNG